MACTKMSIITLRLPWSCYELFLRLCDSIAVGVRPLSMLFVSCECDFKKFNQEKGLAVKSKVNDDMSPSSEVSEGPSDHFGHHYDRLLEPWLVQGLHARTQ